MDYKEIIDKLVRELSFRVGIPNIHNKEHQSIMSEILSEWGEYEVKDTIFEFLAEKENKNDDRYVKKGRYFKLKGKESSEDPTYSKDEKGNYVKMDDKDSDTSSEDEEKAKDAVKKTVGAKSSYGKKQKELEKRVANKEKGIPSSDVPQKSQEEILDTFSTEKDDIIQGRKNPPGTGGSAIGEMYGGTAISEFYESPLSEDEFIEKHFEDVRNSSMSKGMDDKAIKTWLKVSYKTGVSEVNELKNNSKYRFKEPQSKPYPIPVMDPVNKKGTARESLISLFEQKLANAKDDVAKKHYERQLRFIKSREDSDTGVLYETEEGNVGFKHLVLS